MRLAEDFGFGRENPTGTSDLALSSPDGESRRPVGKDECRGDPKGKPAGGVFSFGYFSLDKKRKVTRPAGRNQCLNLEHPLTTAQTYKTRTAPGYPGAVSSVLQITAGCRLTQLPQQIIRFLLLFIIAFRHDFIEDAAGTVGIAHIQVRLGQVKLGADFVDIIQIGKIHVIID